MKYVDIAAARAAKRKLDNRSFFGKSLHVSYAPEFESVEETREKLQERKDTISKKLKGILLYEMIHVAASSLFLLRPFLSLASHIREKKAAKDQLQRETSSRTAEQLPQQDRTTKNITPTPVSATPNNTSADTHFLNITQPSAISAQFSSHHPSSSPSQPQLQNPAQAVMSHPQQHNMYQVPPPPLPSDPILQGLHVQAQSAQYPSQAMHNILGGALPTSTAQHGKTDLVSSHRRSQQATIATSRGGGREEERGGGVERGRAPKRRLERHPGVVTERRSEEGGLYDASGLSKSQRVSAFLSTSSDPGGGSISSASTTSTEGAPVKRKAHERTKQRQTDKTVVMAQQSSTSAEKMPVPNEGYFPIHQLPPLQVSDIEPSYYRVKSSTVELKFILSEWE